jgi:nitrite reductase/ring-hydroxylating ferredoxin subunit
MANELGVRASNLGISARADSSRTLPGWAFTDQAIFEREREAIHFRSWHYAGTTQELVKAGDYLTASIVDQNIIIIREQDGELRGFYNVCQHRAHELLRGRGHVHRITCPYHAWTYGIDGRFSGARGTAVLQSFDNAAFNLKPVRIEVFAKKLIFFNLDPAAIPLRDQAADLEADLEAEIPSFNRLTVAPGLASAEIQANWKVAVDNYLECYHCRNAHPALASLMDLGSFRVDVHPFWMSHKAELGRPDNAAYPVLPECGEYPDSVVVAVADHHVQRAARIRRAVGVLVLSLGRRQHAAVGPAFRHSGRSGRCEARAVSQRPADRRKTWRWSNRCSAGCTRAATARAGSSTTATVR